MESNYYYVNAIKTLARANLCHFKDDQLSSILNDAIDNSDLLCPPEIEENLEHSDNKDEYFDIFTDEDIIERIKENGFLAEFRTQAFHAFRADLETEFQTQLARITK